MSSRGYHLAEIEVALEITDGKLTVSSRSGTKSGALRLELDGDTAELTLVGPGDDRGTATLTGPELSNFRTIVDAVLSDLSTGGAAMEHDSRVLFSGYESLTRADGEYVTSLDAAALERLGLVEADEPPAGGSRQVRCTVLDSGTAIIDLVGEPEAASEFEF